MLCLSNLAVLVWVLICAYWMLKRETRGKILRFLPHISVFAYLVISVLSVAFAPEPVRAANFTMKLALMLIGGFMLFSFAACSEKRLQIMYILTAAAAATSVAYCLATRFGAGSESFGFHVSAYKYGTYIGTLVPLCAVYLFTDSRAWVSLLGVLLVSGAILSAGSLGAVAAIVVGLAVAVVFLRRFWVRLCIVGSVVCAIAGVVLLSSHPAGAALKDDIKLSEQDGLNLRQRYIEWQAETNLLEQRTVTGTGAGCINTYRSSFYYRLPKLNTLKSFDQNGYLATAAETGIIGLVSFCWVVLHYGRLAFSQVVTTRRKLDVAPHRFAAANLAGLVGAAVANLFSSVHYNGILIVFVLTLALTAGTQKLYGEQQDA